MIFVFFIIVLMSVFYLQIKLLLTNKILDRMQELTLKKSLEYDNKDLKIQNFKNIRLDYHLNRLDHLQKTQNNLQDIIKDMKSKRLFWEKIFLIRNKIWNLFQCRSIRCIIVDILDHVQIVPQKIIHLTASKQSDDKNSVCKSPRQEDHKICSFLSKNHSKEILVFNTRTQTVAVKIGINAHLSSFVVIPMIRNGEGSQGIFVFENIDPEDIEKARLFSCLFWLYLDDLIPDDI